MLNLIQETTREQYAISARGEFHTADLTQHIDAFFLRARQCGFCNDISFTSLLFAADQMFFNSL